MTSTIHREPGESRGSRRRGISSPLRAVAILGACGALSLGALGFSSAASAAEIKDAITGVSTSTGGEAPIDQVFRVDATWAIPKGSTVKAGDTFTLQLPKELEAMQTTFDLIDPDGAVVATAQVDKGTGLAVVTLGDYVTDHPENVKGTLFFDVRFKDDVEPGTEIRIQFGDDHTDVTALPGEGSDQIDSIHKYGWSAGGNRSGWSIEIPGPLTDAVLTDRPQDQTIICEDTTIDGTAVDGPVVLSGTREGDARPTDFADHVPQPKIDCEPGAGDDEAKLTVDLGDIPEGTVYRLEYLTTPDPGQTMVTNTWKLVSTETEQEGDAEHRVYNAGGTGSGESPVTPPPTTPPATTPPATTPPATTPPVETTPPQTSTPPASTTPPRTTTPAATPSTTTAAPVAVTTPPTPGSAPARLPRTGSEVLPLAGIAAGLVALGTGAVAIAGRRRND